MLEWNNLVCYPFHHWRWICTRNKTAKIYANHLIHARVSVIFPALLYYCILYTFRTSPDDSEFCVRALLPLGAKVREELPWVHTGSGGSLRRKRVCRSCSKGYLLYWVWAWPWHLGSQMGDCYRWGKRSTERDAKYGRYGRVKGGVPRWLSTLQYLCITACLPLSIIPSLTFSLISTSPSLSSLSRLFLSLSLSLSLWISFCLCLSLSLSFTVFLSLCLSVFLSLSLSRSLCQSLSLSLSLSFSLSLSLSFSQHWLCEVCTPFSASLSTLVVGCILSGLTFLRAE